MKKIVSILIAAIMLFSTLSVFADSTPEKMYIFVKAGAEGGDGSKDKPFATFEEARDKIREIKKNGQYPDGGVVVYFREGNYKIDNKIVLSGEQDSGTETGPIVYRSYMEEEVTFVGGVELSVSDFSKVTDPEALKRINKSAQADILVVNLYDLGITDLGELNYFGGGSGYFTQPLTRLEENGVHIPKEQPPELFFGDVIGTIARYPNDDFTLTGKIIQMGDEVQMWSDTFKTYDTFVPYEERVYPPKPSIYEVSKDVKERMPSWQYEDDMWVYGYFSENWSDTSLQVREIDAENGVITTELPSPKPIKRDRRYYIYNVLPELDVPGEYYLDRQTGNLYIYPVDLDGKITFSSLKEQFLLMTNLDNVSFKALSFKGTRGTAIYGEGLTNVHFEHCTISKAAGKGITLYNCLNSSLKSCHIYQTGTGGVYMHINETAARPEVAKNARQTLIPQGNVIENCEIEEFGRINATYSPAISMGGAGNHIRHCSIHGGDHMAMSPDANDLVIEYCEFYDLLRTADDMGAIYDGFSKTRRGQVIRHNYFHDIQSESTSGTAISLVYADDTKDGTTVESNIFENIGGRNMIFYSNGGSAHTLKNNIVINADTFVHFNNHGIDDIGGKYDVSRYDFMDYINNPAYAKYPHFTDLSEKVEDYLPARWNHISQNVLINVQSENSSKALVTEENDLHPSLILPEGSDPGFADIENGNYILREDSEIYETFPDFVAPDFKKMGMYTTPLKILMGEETKAFLAGSPKVYVGFESGVINSRLDAYPEIKEGVAYLPIRYIAESIGASIEYNDETAEITVGVGSKPVVIKPGEYYTVNGNALVPQDKIAEIFSTDIKVFENGVILMGNDIRIGDDFPELTQELARRLCNE